METKINTEKFCGINLFTWKEEEGEFYFYNVNFCIDSMKKYNGCNVLRRMNGTMEIDDEDGMKVVWTGFVSDIPEVKAKLSKGVISDETFETILYTLINSLCEAEKCNKNGINDATIENYKNAIENLKEWKKLKNSDSKS